MRGGSVPRRETFSRDDEGGRVGTEVEKKLRQDVDGQQAVLAKLVVGETHDNEENSENAEAHELDGLAANGVHSGHSHPVAWNSTSKDDDQVADGGVVQVLISVRSTRGGIAYRSEDTMKNISSYSGSN